MVMVLTPKIAERRQPLVKQRPHRVVVLQINSADLAAAVVQIEIARQRGVRRRQLHGLRIAEMLLDVGLRSEQPLLFPAPQPDAHGSIHLQIQRFQNAHHFDHHRAARAIVGSARAAVPGIEMRAHHHDFVFLADPPGISAITL